MWSNMSTDNLHMLIGWVAMFFGVASGAVIGLFFHREKWAGGYGSFRRRMLRLGHISFFGIGFLNLLFGLTLKSMSIPDLNVSIASYGFFTGVVAMPLCCFLTAWKNQFRHLFPIPVIAVSTGIIPILTGWPAS